MLLTRHIPQRLRNSCLQTCQLSQQLGQLIAQHDHVATARDHQACADLRCGTVRLAKTQHMIGMLFTQ